MNPHGKIVAKWEGDMLIIRAEGPFNIDGFSQGLEHVKQTVSSRSHKEWCRLELWDSEAMGDPDVVKMGKDLYKWYVNNGCKVGAVVVKNAVQRHLLTTHVNNMVNVFTNDIEAKKWLLEQ